VEPSPIELTASQLGRQPRKARRSPSSARHASSEAMSAKSSWSWRAVQGPVQSILAIPKIIWELSLGIYSLIWGFKSSPILREEGRPMLHPAVLAR